ncbi:MAG: pseudouridine synthase [Oscillospiraceae bacterium]
METRLQKVLSENGINSRRKADEMIAKGRVKVNGHTAVLGQKVNPAKDLIAVDGQNIQIRKKIPQYYILLNKPRGYITTQSDEMGRKCVADLMKNTPEKVYPIGRLDKNSEGALLFTNDGDFANLIMHPSHHVSKTYRVTVRPDITDEQLIKLSTGVEIDEKMTGEALVKVLEKENGRVVLQMTIYEGRNRQIRKMCEAVGLEVARLKRITIGPIKLGMLPPGEWRELAPGEIAAIRNSVKGNTEEGEAERKQKIQQNKAMAKNFGRAPAAKQGKGQAESKPYDKDYQKSQYGKKFTPAAKDGEKTYGKKFTQTPKGKAQAPRGSFDQIEKSFNRMMSNGRKKG